MVRNAPPSAISGRASDDRADADRMNAEPLRLHGGRVLADRPHREAERRAVEHEAREPERAPRRDRSAASAGTGPARGTGDRTGPGSASGRNGSIRGGVATFGQADAVGEVGQARRQQRDADAGDVLRQAERHGQQRVQQPEGRAGECRDSDAGPQGSRRDRRPASRPWRRR